MNPASHDRLRQVLPFGSESCAICLCVQVIDVAGIGKGPVVDQMACPLEMARFLIAKTQAIAALIRFSRQMLLPEKQGPGGKGRTVLEETWVAIPKKVRGGERGKAAM